MREVVSSACRAPPSGYAVVPLARPHETSVKRAECCCRSASTATNSFGGVSAHSRLARTLLRRVKAATGHVPGEYVHLLRVAAARGLLETGGAPVQKVAEAVGYEDIASFRQIFKRHTGMTPADYRSRFGPLAVTHAELGRH